MTEHDSYEALLAQQKRSQDAYSSAAQAVSKGKYPRTRADEAAEEAPFRITVETLGHDRSVADQKCRKSIPKSPSTPSKDFYHVVDETLGEVDEDLGPEERG